MKLLHYVQYSLQVHIITVLYCSFGKQNRNNAFNEI